MQTIIVEVFVPAVSESFDFRLPSTAHLKDVVDEVIRILEATQHNLMVDKEQPMLCDRMHNRAMNLWETVAEAGLQDGARLILV